MVTAVNSVLLFLSLFLCLSLGIFIYLKDRKSAINQSFAMILICVSFWSATFLIFSSLRSPAWVLFWRRTTPIGSALVAGYFYYFSLVFPKDHIPLSRWQKFLILSPGYVFALLSFFTPYLIDGYLIRDLQHPFIGKPIFGPLYYLYALYLVIFFFLSLFNLFFKYLKSEGREKLQIFYVLFGMFLSITSGLVFSLFLPILGIAQFFTLGPPFALFLVGFITYAIVRHRLLNIEDFLTRGVFFLATATVLIGTAALILSGRMSYLLPFYTAITNLTLALFVLFHNIKSKINRSFAVISLAIVVWTGVIFLYWQTGNPALALWHSKIAYASTAFIPAFLIYFTMVFPREEAVLSFPQKLLIFSPIAAILALDFLNLIVRGVEKTSWGFNLLPGPFYFVFSIYFIGYMGYAFFNLARKYLRYSGSAKMQVAYVFLGFFLGSVFPIITNLILPALGNTSLTSIGPSFTIVLVGLIAYAILKHRLMSIEIIIQRGAIYTVATISIMAIYALVVIVSETFFRKIMGYSSVIITAFAALIIAIVYQPLVRYFQALTDRIFFRGRYDYQKTLREISQKIAAVIKLEELTRLIASSFVDTMRVSEISFLLLEKEKEHFRSVALAVPRYKKIEIDVSSPIVFWLSMTKDILVREELEDEIGRQAATGKEGEVRKVILEEVRDEMERLGTSIWIPIISKEELIGIIALGNKLSGDIFTTEDLALLTTLASQTAVALDNARLYDEVVSMKNYSEEILQSMTNGVLTTDSRGRVVTYNYMAERITGRRLDEVLGKTCEEIWGKRGAITQAIENTLKDRCYLNHETSLASPERGLMPVAFSSTLLRDGHGKKMGALLSIQDQTEMKELEGKVRRADKLSALATMAAGMAHEIKNPLSSMKVFSQLLPKKFDDPEYRKKLEEILPREIDRIDRIVESLLGFARATAPTFVKVKIENAIEETLQYFEGQAKNAGVKIVRNYADLPEVEVDRGQIAQVFSNLILNAIQALSEGGELTIATLPGKKVDNILQTIKIQVSDTGHGMSEEMQKKLFDPFFTTKYGGTGLGLTITHSIVDGHKGLIDVESKIGRGTTFTVTLPVSQGLV
jgi:PAS domain S-box-containing protein